MSRDLHGGSDPCYWPEGGARGKVIVVRCSGGFGMSCGGTGITGLSQS